MLRITARHLSLDFDGVIKESLKPKALAFGSVFGEYGNKEKKYAIELHYANIGKSRYWKADKVIDRFGIDRSEEDHIYAALDQALRVETEKSPWVKGIQGLLRMCKQRNVGISVVTAIPQHEIELICENVGLGRYVSDVYGGEWSKADALRMIKRKAGGTVCFVGDSTTDVTAAMEADVLFVLRRHRMNEEIILPSNGKEVGDFCEVEIIRGV